MYKIIENNQIIDVMESLRFVKYLPKTKRSIEIDERQANGILSSDASVIYHIAGTKDIFPEGYKTVRYEKIEEDEYKRLTQQLKVNTELADKVKELEKQVQMLQRALVSFIQ